MPKHYKLVFTVMKTPPSHSRFIKEIQRWTSTTPSRMRTHRALLNAKTVFPGFRNEVYYFIKIFAFATTFAANNVARSSPKKNKQNIGIAQTAKSTETTDPLHLQNIVPLNIPNRNAPVANPCHPVPPWRSIAQHPALQNSSNAVSVRHSRNKATCQA